ncbi:MAG: NUDIX domain-containing protein [Gorillibacterium sp.]|nr:NUDIX domain-containing protein [Gorillibacterium sp.]
MVIVSAGGVVFRKGEQGLEIQLIKDRFGKITLAKGKMEAGETVEQTAIREIEEETGTWGRIIKPLMVIHYQDDVHHSAKEVHYFLVEAVGGSDKVQIEEIDGVGWYTPKEALRLQKQSGYGNNDNVLIQAITEMEGDQKPNEI